MGVDVLKNFSAQTEMIPLSQMALRFLICSPFVFQFLLAQYQILLHGCWYEVFGGEPDNFPTELDGRNQDALTQPLLAEENLMVHQSPSYTTLGDDSPLSSPAQYPHLFLPGRIIHIVEESSTRR